MTKIHCNNLNWPALCKALLECGHVPTLQRWLDETVSTGSLYRALRVHGRLSAVRRAQELEALRKGIVAALGKGG